MLVGVKRMPSGSFVVTAVIPFAPDAIHVDLIAEIEIHHAAVDWLISGTRLFRPGGR